MTLLPRVSFSKTEDCVSFNFVPAMTTTITEIWRVKYILTRWIDK